MTELSAIAAAVRAGRITAADLVRESLRRIDELDPAINSVVARRDDLAIAEANAMDARIARGEDPGPLSGMPLLVKDLEDVAGMVTTAGSVSLANSSAAVRDSRTPELLRAAGAIVVGKTNLPEFASEGWTSNLLFGTTGNPWSLGWTPGGSSGGSAAALAAGLAPLATGTDGGGSVRIPAAFCGLLGLKASRGVFGRRPIPDWMDFSADGPFATNAADLRLLFNLMVGRAVGDPESHGLVLNPPAKASHLLLVERTADYGPLPAMVAEAFALAVAKFATLVGCDPRPLSPLQVIPEGNPDADWFLITSAEHVGALGREWVQAHRGEFHPVTAEFFDYGLKFGLDEYLAARRRRFYYAERLDELIGGTGLMLSPTNVVEGFPADGRLDDTGRVGLRGPEDYNTGIQNMTGHPAISLPAGVLANGVPFGLQVTAARGQDTWLIDLAAAWEAAHPWPLVAPGYSQFAAAFDALS